jgi:hypothetical protein
MSINRPLTVALLSFLCGVALVASLWAEAPASGTKESLGEPPR